MSDVKQSKRPNPPGGICGPLRATHVKSYRSLAARVAGEGHLISIRGDVWRLGSRKIKCPSQIRVKGTKHGKRWGSEQWVRSSPDCFGRPLAFPSQARVGESSSCFSTAWEVQRKNWHPQLTYFSQTYLAVAWDARGYGESDDCEGERVFARDFVRDLLSILDLLGAGRAHLVGLSMGGMIAQCFYFAHPHRVASLVLADTFPSFSCAWGGKPLRVFLAARIETVTHRRHTRRSCSCGRHVLCLRPVRPRVHASVCCGVCRI